MRGEPQSRELTMGRYPARISNTSVSHHRGFNVLLLKSTLAVPSVTKVMYYDSSQQL